MPNQNYSVNHYTISNLLTFVQTRMIAMPEIQRPFVMYFLPSNVNRTN